MFVQLFLIRVYQCGPCDYLFHCQAGLNAVSRCDNDDVARYLVTVVRCDVMLLFVRQEIVLMELAFYLFFCVCFIVMFRIKLYFPQRSTVLCNLSSCLYEFLDNKSCKWETKTRFVSTSLACKQLVISLECATNMCTIGYMKKVTLSQWECHFQVSNIPVYPGNHISCKQ